MLLRPRSWGAHLLMVLALAAAIALGVWQIEVWSAGREAEARDLTDAPARALTDVLGPDAALTGDDVGRPVTLSGEWLPQSTVFVADRPHDGERGYWVATPVLVGRSAIPVVRGWSPRPEADPVSGAVEVTGWLQASEGQRDVVDDDPDDDVLPQMRIASLTQRVDADLYGAYVVSRTPTAGLDAVSPESIPSVSPVTGLKNLLYGFQWWIFGGFAVYVWWRWCRDVLAAERAAGRETEPTPEGRTDDATQQVPSSA